MKIWEMIKELTENPDKKFTNNRANKGSYVALDEDKTLCWFGEGQRGQSFLANFLRDDEWEEVKEPVDFMTAFRAWREENKTIICKIDKDSTVAYEGNRTNFSFHAECIASGKWYIED
ncbi:MAG: hypothetical protein GX053_12730 [Tissierella sp.]|nr:hypothetical protein [Tissierella sp.]